MNARTKEYVESAKNGDQLEAKAKELAQAVGMDSVGEFGAAYIEREILNGGVLDYEVYPNSAIGDYAVIEDITPRQTSGANASVSSGPMQRLRENGFIVKEVSAYTDGAVPHVLGEYDGSLPDAFIAVHIAYIGAEHPIIEYWDEDE